MPASCYDDIVANEAEIVRRIQSLPNGGHLLLADPLRLLREIGLHLDSDVLESLKSAHPQFFVRTGREHTYDTLRTAQPNSNVRITIEGLFPEA